MRLHGTLLPLLLAAGLLTACGDEDPAPTADVERPRIVASTSILGDVVGSLLGEAAEVETIIPAGADPHEFQASARQAAALREADLVVVNGAGFEEGLEGVIDAAEADGATVHEAISAVDALPLARESEEEHAHEEEEDEEHEHGGGVDPHFFADPVRMAAAAEGILEAAVAAAPELDTEPVRRGAASYLERLRSLDGEVEQLLGTVPADRRVLVTNHDVFGYFADRYDFEIVGTVIPGGSTGDETSAAALRSLVDVIRSEDVPAIFADTSSPDRLARTLAAEVGAIEVVELYSESLGDAGSGAATYPDMVRTNARRIAAALG